MKKIKSVIIGILLIISILTIINPVSAATLEVGPGKTYATINAAITAAAAGDTILVYPGTYNENVLIDKSNLTLKSVGGRDVTIVGPGTGNNENGVIYINTGLGLITVEGFTVILSPDKLSGYYPCGIRSRYTTTCYIFNNKIKVTGALRNGIQVGGENSQIVGNIVEGGPLTGNWLSTGILACPIDVNAKNILIKDNHLLGGMDVGIGVITWGSGVLSDVVVDNNIIEKTRSAGISIGGKVSNTLVKNNIIKNNPMNGLEEIHNNYDGYAVGNPTGTKVYYNQFCNNGKDIDIYDDPNDIYVIGDPKLDARGNTGCKTTLPMPKFLKILIDNRCKNHPDLEGCNVI